MTRWVLLLPLVMGAACSSEEEGPIDCLGRRLSAPATGTAVLNWNAPSARVDGSPLDDLSGYRIRYGVEPDKLRCQIEIREPMATTWTVTALSPGTWYFAVTSFDSDRVESELSGVVSKQIQ